MLAACSPGSGSTDKAETPSTVSTDVAAAGTVTLKFTDFWGGAEGEWIKQVIADFQKKYPNVTIDRTTEDWGQLNSTLNLQLQDDGGPDIATANNGWQSLGTLAKGGLVVNLDAYAKAYGWDKKVPTTIARQNQFSTDFKTMGSGSWFSTPMARTSLIGLYYNADKLKSLGINPPASLADLEAAAAKAKAAGEVPFEYGSLDSSTTVLLGVQALLADKKKLNDYIYDTPSVKAADVGMTEAITLVKKWADAGYYPKNYQGIDYQTAVANYVGGKGVFRWEYTGSLGLNAAQQGHYGYVQLPQASGSGTVGVGAAPGAMVVSAKSKHPDVAAAFLDYMMSAETGQAAVDRGLVPALSPDAKAPASSLSLTGESAAAAKLDSDDGYVPYFDWSSPTMLDTIGANLQLVLAGKMTPDKFTEAVDKDRDAFLAQQS
ncbi:raffinose/stachyose/melibiose transport system substrate-binding protein [Actinoplanes tereljensis]|uniref:Sugar ABC transporter substrate-binding protein n=1 Tax=Paractinoplanes tereljensis TaxID=571912 RepID=A0A919NPV7_9ACTN|nr:extracellular solute-binding protein [Actinoplanes tereljensis]GIF22869.1 sugar ABC transporter substrate-binding protein [Actinoplanes tereljensis]